MTLSPGEYIVLCPEVRRDSWQILHSLDILPAETIIAVVGASENAVDFCAGNANDAIVVVVCSSRCIPVENGTLGTGELSCFPTPKPQFQPERKSRLDYLWKASMMHQWSLLER